MSPAERYRQELAAGNLIEDEAQRQAVTLLDDLHGRLERPRPRSFWPFRRRHDGPERGLYLWGGVGRGKTMLMDLFHESLSVGKVRMHFHRFMRQVHDGPARTARQSGPVAPGCGPAGATGPGAVLR